ncbi:MULTISPECIES: ABC transporter ATP-binding protein [unclassified Frigoribacterium]|uniref:ABC transporter ATP-binding protein n=1 Tax=unclassified Frigoribacterium TaxID=2627005 RepID=UPI0005C2E73A|nr:ABC transporter ATP-binding protein [Frigoribacterium sp. MEB024]KIU03738.1 iron-dicitrate transporter ATP-binding subunit [Frigoribacterium sp. MEB024]MBD8537410.1 ABC transporter ATP-binding protein [Frigoribacterium sp. CFBP 8751]
MTTDLPLAATAPSSAALRADDVSVAYDGVDVVRGARLELRPGCVTALVGPNGSGKSTLLRTLARLQKPRTGSLTLAAPPAGVEWSENVVRASGKDDSRPLDRTSASDETVDGFELSLRQFARRVALLTQGRPTPGGLSVRDVVEFGRYPHRGRWGRSDPDGPAAVDRALELTGVADLADRGVDQLSGGQLQRVWLASCLAQDTGVLLLDEPTTYLDLRYQVELLDLVRDLADSGRIAVGVVLHDLDQAAALADRIVVLSEGRIVAEGDPGDVLTPRLLTDVWGIRIDVDTDPTTGHLRTRAIGRHHTRAETPVR